MWGQQVSSINNSNKLQDGVKIKYFWKSTDFKICSKEPLQNYSTTKQNYNQYFKHLSQVDPVYVFQQKFYNFSDIYITFLRLSAH